MTSPPAPGPVAGLSFRGVARDGWRLYLSRAGTVLPPFIGVYVLLRVALQAAADADLSTGTDDLVKILLELVLPPVVGSLMFAAAAVVYDEGRLAGSFVRLVPALLGAAAGSVALAILLFLTLQGIGIFVQAAVYGPPVVMHAIALDHLLLADAWSRASRLLRRDARLVLYLLLISMAVGIVMVLLLGIVEGALSGRMTADARHLLVFAGQGVLFGVAFPYVAACGLAGYRALAPAT